MNPSEQQTFSRTTRQIEHFFIPLSSQVEKIIKICLLFALLSLFLSQAFILMSEDNQALVNKTIRYEGVFNEDPIKAKATLQRK